MAAEKQFENQVKRWLKEQGIYPLGTSPEQMPLPPVGYFEKRWGGGYSQAGLPDLHVVVNGINLDVELKSKTGRPSDLQKFMIRQINQSGSLALVLYPDGFQNFQTIVKGVMDCSFPIQGLNALMAALTNSSCDTLKG